MSMLQGVSALQHVLAATNPGIKVDGIMGDRTRNAYMHSRYRGFIREMMRVNHGFDPETILAKKVPANIEASLFEASSLSGIDSSSVFAFADIESGFNPSAVSSAGYKGIGQMGQPSWDEAKVVARRDYGVDIGDFAKNWDDPRYGAIAMVAYMSITRQRLISAGVWPTDGAIYLGYNQGVRGVVRLMNLQSASPTEKRRAIIAMRANPPQDGKGPTENPFDFLNRWNNVVGARVLRYAA